MTELSTFIDIIWSNEFQSLIVLSFKRNVKWKMSYDFFHFICQLRHSVWCDILQALEIKPDDKVCLVSRSKCYLMLGDPQAALKDAEAALEDDNEFSKVGRIPNFCTACNSLNEKEVEQRQMKRWQWGWELNHLVFYLVPKGILPMW